MAFTTFDSVAIGALAGNEFIKAATPTLVAGRPQSLFYLAGIPGAAVAPTPGLAGEALTTYTGQMPFTNPTGGEECRLARLQAQATIAGQLLLCDRLWHNSGFTITSTAAQTVNSVAWPARDANGSANGDGVLLGVEVSGVTGAGTPVITVSYTNSANTAGRTATNIISTVVSSPAGAFYPIGLQSGDIGVRSAQTLTLSATWISGTIHLVAYRVIARLELTLAQTPNAIDPLTGLLPRAYNDTVPFLIFIPSTTTASVVTGHAVWTHG